MCLLFTAIARIGVYRGQGPATVTGFFVYLNVTQTGTLVKVRE